jgi:prepilin-type N-terminal cleavage/methylation domain-containing protein
MDRAGFSMIELLVAMAIFLVIGGAAVRLFRQHVPLFTVQQNQTSVNIALRNAAAQLQIDLVNAGSGYYQGANIPTLPLGITVLPGSGTCYTGSNQTYSAGCFDTVSIITVDPNTPPSHPAVSGSNCVSTTSSVLFATPIGSTTLNQLAGAYNAGDEVLLVNSNGSQMATMVLSKSGQVTGGKVQFQHNPTATYNNTVSQNSYSDDYYNIANPNNNNKLGTQFCSTDWVLRVNATTYGVDTSNPANPVLVRSSNNNKPQTIADQIIGFRIGSFAQDNTTLNYQWEYDTTNYDFNTIQAVRASLIGRTNPISGSIAGFRNTFDNGTYKVEGVSIVVDPRNLSMNN